MEHPQEMQESQVLPYTLLPKPHESDPCFGSEGPYVCIVNQEGSICLLHNFLRQFPDTPAPFEQYSKFTP